MDQVGKGFGMPSHPRRRTVGVHKGNPLGREPDVQLLNALTNARRRSPAVVQCTCEPASAILYPAVVHAELTRGNPDECSSALTAGLSTESRR